MDAAHIRPLVEHITEGQIFKIGDTVEVNCFPNHPKAQSDVQGWKRARVTNLRDKFVYIEFDVERHPDQLPLLITTNKIRHEAPIDSAAS